MTLPEDALARLRQPHLVVHVGDVWWVPKAHVIYRGGKDRLCLVVGLESAPGAKVPVLAHLVPGSRRRGSDPTIAVNAGEAGPNQRTLWQPMLIRVPRPPWAMRRAEATDDPPAFLGPDAPVAINGPPRLRPRSYVEQRL